VDYGFHLDNELMPRRRITLACRVFGPDIREKPPPRLSIKPCRVTAPTMVYTPTGLALCPCFSRFSQSNRVLQLCGSQVLTFIVLDSRYGSFVEPDHAVVSTESRCRNMVTSIHSICFAFAVREPCFFTCSLQEGPSSSHDLSELSGRDTGTSAVPPAGSPPLHPFA
jgi:hypothetical protein